MIHLPVCVKCNREFRPERNGVLVLEMASYGIYKMAHADLLKCPSCGTEIVSGYAYAWLEHFKDGDQMAQELKATPLAKIYHSYEHSADTLEKRQQACVLWKSACPRLADCMNVNFVNIAPFEEPGGPLASTA